MKYLLVLFIVNLAALWGQPPPHTYMLTVQHSGSMWTLYSLHTMTQQRICDCNPNRAEPRKLIRDWHKFFNYQSTINSEKPPIYFSHSSNRFTLANLPLRHHTDKLLIVLRNFKECFLSLKRSPQAVIDMLSAKNLDIFLSNLVTNLKLYDSWNPDNRLLIYYEDLMTNPSVEFEKISNWLHERPEVVTSFMKDYNKHKSTCFNLYKERFSKGMGNTKSKGDPISHTKPVDLNTLKKMDYLFKSRFPQLWKYFERFES